jgi:hypothetical protein
MQTRNESSNTLPACVQWTPLGRAVVFTLSAASIWCLLAEFYGMCSMRTFTFAVLIPATVVLLAIALFDRARGDRQLWRAVLIGSIGGFVAACAYDLFRLPWVMGAIDQIGPTWLRLPLFKVFPRFGALILGESFDGSTRDSQFSLAAHLIGWVYHFSNGMTFGVMYMALVGDAGKRSWLWAIALAVGLEIAMLVTPYTSYFAIHMTALFIAVTLTAHLVFGVALGLIARQMSRAPLASPAVAA